MTSSGYGSAESQTVCRIQSADGNAQLFLAGLWLKRRTSCFVIFALFLFVTHRESHSARPFGELLFSAWKMKAARLSPGFQHLDTGRISWRSQIPESRTRLGQKATQQLKFSLVAVHSAEGLHNNLSQIRRKIGQIKNKSEVLLTISKLSNQQTLKLKICARQIVQWSPWAPNSWPINFSYK